MRRAEPLEPEIEAALAAIDATLGGEPVGPEHAELAELALILRDERPAPDLTTATALDERVAGLARPPARRTRPRWSPRIWLGGPAAVLAAVALVVVITNGGGGGASISGASSRAASGTASSAAASAQTSTSSSSSSSGASGGHVPDRAARPGATVPAPSGSGTRQVVQSAQLALSAAPSRIDDVAQQVFDVVDAEKGFVTSSHVSSTGGPDANARFALSVPVARLQRTVSELSRLRGAHVVSRTDDTTDITGEVGGAGRRLAEVRALRRSLLRQLAAATTSEAIASLKAQLRDADAAISRAASTLNGLHRQVSDSRLTVSIQASAVPVHPVSHGGGFTLGRAAHDAGRVLVVVAGVGLIALAVLVPLVLALALVVWATLAVRRRRREAMLDLM